MLSVFQPKAPSSLLTIVPFPVKILAQPKLQQKVSLDREGDQQHNLIHGEELRRRMSKRRWDNQLRGQGKRAKNG